MGRRALISLFVAFGLAAAPAAASANTETVTAGNVTAELSYTPTGIGYTGVHVKIVRGGVTQIDQPAALSPSCPECGTGPAYGGHGDSVHIVQLDATPDPEVVFDLYTGGAHCCFYSQIFGFKSGSYASTVHDFGDPGYSFFDPENDGKLEFRSGDPRFAYAFGSFASSRFPPQIWRYADGLMLDVTRSYPTLIQADIRRLKRQFKKFKSLGIKSLLAAHAADRFMLNQPIAAFALVHKAKRKGYLDNAGKFLRKLERFLIRTGYEVPPND
jgi:hypothetical protein